MPGGEPMIESYERLVLRLVEEIGSLRAEIKGLSINTTAELKVTSTEIRGLREQVTKQNGRVGVIEDWRHAVQLADAHDSGVVEGKVGLQRRQMAALVGMVTVGGGLASTVATVIARLVA